MSEKQFVGLISFHRDSIAFLSRFIEMGFSHIDSELFFASVKNDIKQRRWCSCPLHIRLGSYAIIYFTVKIITLGGK